MAEFTSSESLQMDSIRKLIDSPLFDIEYKRGDITFSLEDLEPISEDNPELAGVVLSDRLKRCSLRFSDISAEWSFVGDERSLDGEFRVPHLYLALIEDPPLCNDLAGDSERALLSELRMIDSAPRRATGEAAFVRVQPHKETLEVWYQDRYLFDAEENTQGFLRMEVDYCGYLEALRMAMGVLGWQMLFVDASLRAHGFREHVENLRNMLDVFPDVFPEYDYTPLRARLEARL